MKVSTRKHNKILNTDINKRHSTSPDYHNAYSKLIKDAGNPNTARIPYNSKGKRPVQDKKSNSIDIKYPISSIIHNISSFKTDPVNSTCDSRSRERKLVNEISKGVPSTNSGKESGKKSKKAVLSNIDLIKPKEKQLRK